MARFCVASLLLLFAVLHQGSALHCFESTCLNDPNIDTCVNNNRTVLKECNIAGLRQVLFKLQGSGGTVPPVPTGTVTWTCVKHEISGMQDSLARRVELRMCFPEAPTSCDTVAAAAKGLEYKVGQQVTSHCYACTSDSCNPAHRPSASWAVAVVLAAAASLQLLRR